VTIAGLAASTRAGEPSLGRITALLDLIRRDPYHAFVAADPEAGRRAAAIDALVAAGSDPGPLAGVPVALKDIIDHAGRVTTAGSSFYRHEAERSATVVDRLEVAGAIVVGRTGLHEFAFGFSSENEWFGPVRNPWDPATSAGGSSGGSAAAVASGMVPVGLGTDTGGSVRVPAAMCGCVGLKVTHGRVPLTGVFPLAPSLDTVGPITTTVADAAAVYAVIAGDDPEDPWSSPHAVVGPTGPADLRGLRVGVPHPWVDRPLAPRVGAGFNGFIAALEHATAEVVVIMAPALDPARLPRATYAEVAAVHRAWLTADPSRYGREVRERMLVDLEHDTDAVTAGWAWRHRLSAAFERQFGEVDLLITPTTATLRKEIGVDLVEAGAGPEPYRPALSWFTTLVNQAGLPALALPLAGTASEGPPVSVQLIGARFTEDRLLAVGLALEKAGIVGFTPPG
jgi:Asp-tRNA(Asn)/Glu-tRNA(Gln) amidotransferase A subunit family amidase